MKNSGNLYPKNSKQAELNRKKQTLFDQGWNESPDIYIDRLKKMLQDSQRYIDKLHKTVYDKNQKMEDMQNHIYFLEDELYHLTNQPQENFEGQEDQNQMFEMHKNDNYSDEQSNYDMMHKEDSQDIKRDLAY
ncbi:hypothetical protein MY04_3584 [Flammeovirga sp. MY04]|uniref:hypothetical protein n=1 Tax=Flammeovirga sp. MY04 TaxID=1191459 RepID=UPI00080626A3|nr:hypothetical protein [Flammeovirga sp. MY04]ANQ50932.1 hypothetical protein MY04_3584 [Flammeovirga sp. MY04]